MGLGPGLLVAATGVGAGDLATAAFTGSHLGPAVLWAVLVGAALKLRVELAEEGEKIFGKMPGPFHVLYANGPIIEPSQSETLPSYEPLAMFRSEVAENGTPGGVMTHSPAITAGQYGAGRVICFSPHPEQSEGLEVLIRRKWSTWSLIPKQICTLRFHTGIARRFCERHCSLLTTTPTILDNWCCFDDASGHGRTDAFAQATTE